MLYCFSVEKLNKTLVKEIHSFAKLFGHVCLILRSLCKCNDRTFGFILCGCVLIVH